MEVIENINKALLQLRESLSNLNSAREQVTQVTAESKEVVDATANLSRDVKHLADQISEETQAVITQFASRLKEAQTGLTTVINEGKDLFAVEIEKSQQSTTQLKTETEKVLRQSLKALTETLDEVKTVTQKTIDEVASVSTGALKELTTVSTDAIEVQQTEISDALESMSEYCERIQSLIDALSELNLSSQILSMEKKIEDIRNQQYEQQEVIHNTMNKIGRNQLITWILLIMIILLMLIFR